MASSMAEQESVLQRLMDEGYTEEQVQMILGLAGLEDEKNQLADQMKYANKLRGQAAPEGRQAGNVYEAASLLEHIANVGEFWQGNRSANKITERQSALGQDQMRRRLEYLRGGATAKAPQLSWQPAL